MQSGQKKYLGQHVTKSGAYSQKVNFYLHGLSLKSIKTLLPHILKVMSAKYMNYVVL